MGLKLSAFQENKGSCEFMGKIINISIKGRKDNILANSKTAKDISRNYDYLRWALETVLFFLYNWTIIIYIYDFASTCIYIIVMNIFAVLNKYKISILKRHKK
jgi:hypothetical protein